VPPAAGESRPSGARIHRTYLSDVERGSRNICLVNIGRVAALARVLRPRLTVAPGHGVPTAGVGQPYNNPA
jgi:hypothetical protein